MTLPSNHEWAAAVTACTGPGKKKGERGKGETEAGRWVSPFLMAPGTEDVLTVKSPFEIFQQLLPLAGQS